MLVFIHINKTAGRTVRYILRSSYGMRHCEAEPWDRRAPDDRTPFTSDDLRRLRRIYPRLESIAGHRVVGYVDLEDGGSPFRYFTFLRDPLKLCASRFQYHVDFRRKRGLVFDEWIEREWLRNAQTKQIAGTPSADAAIRAIEGKDMFVGLTEAFDESMVLMQALRAPDLDISYSSVNVARDNSIAEQLLADSHTRAAIAEANRADSELYEYVKNELFPRFQREYGPSLHDAVAAYRNRPDRKFNTRNLAASRVKQYALYKPLLRLHRSKTGVKMVDRPAS